mmetsp:Transcript_436/g.550  ORF Transcript_436/g.550 Transcript_436/m.550 type:complete len:82 (-) Transcript_436:80-325(-)|eukprot:CAMPEP_0185723320 /NCGR_PEP_ID=MMETSP1171-20130828/201_1 /TAXON_ID=374046 /ORGANISM="Helicotheca tamensis, Strain CCMP826" /LENGTH=81 /DNA_ID=CAMNT_0028391003 /DNA_START=197 /DNA_END=442 /DNA_ORIENTATION=+
MAGKKKDTGRDIKSLVINLATTLLFILPIVAYFYREESLNFAYAVAASLALAFITPPVGWKRPHPYTDKPGNEPYPATKDN